MASSLRVRAPSAAQAAALSSAIDGGGTFGGVTFSASTKAGSFRRHATILGDWDEISELYDKKTSGWTVMSRHKELPDFDDMDGWEQDVFTLGIAVGA